MKTHRENKKWTCVVCRSRQIKTDGMLCVQCCESYDRALRGDNTTYALVMWAANRSWRFARKGALRHGQPR